MKFHQWFPTDQSQAPVWVYETKEAVAASAALAVAAVSTAAESPPEAATVFFFWERHGELGIEFPEQYMIL